MQKGFSLRALVDECGIPLTTLRNYRKRGIISPDVADKSGKLILYSDAQIEIAKAYRSEHPPKNNKDHDADEDDSTTAASKSAGKKAYIVNPPESLDVKFNCLNIYLRDNGAFDVDAHFDTTSIETAYRRFVDIFLQAAADIPALNGWDNFPTAKKLIQNVNGWENELGDQIFFKEANDCLCVDPNEDTVYIFGKFYQQTTAPVAEPQLNLTAETNDDATSSTDQPVEFEPASVIDTESLIAEPLENKTLEELADEANHYAAQGDACFKQGLNFYFATGRRLIEAKSRLPHGQWQPWLNDNFFASTDTAENYMKLVRRFGF